MDFLRFLKRRKKMTKSNWESAKEGEKLRKTLTAHTGRMYVKYTLKMKIYDFYLNFLWRSGVIKSKYEIKGNIKRKNFGIPCGASERVIKKQLLLQSVPHSFACNKFFTVFIAESEPTHDAQRKSSGNLIKHNVTMEIVKLHCVPSAHCQFDLSQASHISKCSIVKSIFLQSVMISAFSLFTNWPFLWMKIVSRYTRLLCARLIAYTHASSKQWDFEAIESIGFPMKNPLYCEVLPSYVVRFIIIYRYNVFRNRSIHVLFVWTCATRWLFLFRQKNEYAHASIVSISSNNFEKRDK